MIKIKLVITELVEKGENVSIIQKNVRLLIVKLNSDENTVTKATRIIFLNINNLKIILTGYKKDKYEIVQLPTGRNAKCTRNLGTQILEKVSSLVKGENRWNVGEINKQFLFYTITHIAV